MQYHQKRKDDIDVATSTTRRDLFRYKKYIKPQIGKKRISEITAKEIKACLKKVTEGRQVTRKELINIKSVLNGIFSYAIDEGIILHNPVRDINTRDLKCKPVNNDNKVYTDDERHKLLDYMDDVPANGYSLGVRFLFRQDMRIAELKALKWQDYDFDRQTISICKQIVERQDENGKMRNVLIERTKTETGSREQPISKAAAAVLAEAERLHPDHKPGDLIFTNAAGNPLDTDKFNSHLKEWCNAAGIRYLSSHKMRFYAVTALARAGMDLVAIQHNSGHKRLSTTLGYIRQANIQTANAEMWDKIFT